MNSPVALIKRAPKWSLYTAGGVVVGGFALRMYKNRTTSTGDVPADTTTDATQIGSGPAYGTPSSAPGIIVPPIVLGSQSIDQSGTGLGALQDLFMSGTQGLFDAYSTILGQTSANWSQSAAQQGQLLDTTVGSISALAVAGAGAAPQPAAVNPTPVYTPVYVPAPQVATPAPYVPPAPAPDPCTGEYPNESGGQCYKVVCASGNGDHAKGRWHYYKNGKQVRVSSTC